MTRLILNSDVFTVRHGHGVLHDMPIDDDCLGTSIVCENDEIEVDAARRSGTYALWLAELELVQKSTHHVARNVTMLGPLSLEIQNNSEDPVRVPIDEHRIILMRTVLGEQPAANRKFLIGFDEITATIVSDGAGRALALGDSSKCVILPEPDLTVVIEPYSWLES